MSKTQLLAYQDVMQMEAGNGPHDHVLEALAVDVARRLQIKQNKEPPFFVVNCLCSRGASIDFEATRFATTFYCRACGAQRMVLN